MLPDLKAAKEWLNAVTSALFPLERMKLIPLRVSTSAIFDPGI
jgi:hypothetical protein